MSTATQTAFANDSWHTKRNARTLRAFMAIRNAEIAARIVELRNSRGKPPQEVVAQAIGVSYRTYQNWESGEAKPAYRNLSSLAAYYGVSEDYILTGRVDEESPAASGSQLDRIEQALSGLAERLTTLENDLRRRAIEAPTPELPGELGRYEPTDADTPANQTRRKTG